MFKKRDEYYVDELIVLLITYCQGEWIIKRSIDCLIGFLSYRQYFSQLTEDTIIKHGQFWNYEASLAALTSLLFFEIQRNGLLRTRGLLSLSHPTDIILAKQHAHFKSETLGYDFEKFIELISISYF